LLLVGCASQPTAGSGAAAGGSAAASRGAEQSGAPASQPAPLTPYRFVFTGENFSSLPFHIAQTQGFYTKYGLAVEMVTMPSVTAVAALSTGDLDANGTVGTSIKAALAGMPVKVVFITAANQLFEMVARPEILRGDQLRGKTVASAVAGGTVDLVTQAALKHFGLTENDVTYLRTRADQNVRFEQLRQGQIDASMFNPPLNFQARREGMNMLVNGRDIFKVPLTGVSARTSSLTNPQERDTLLRFLKANFAAMEWIRANPREAARALAEWLQYDPSLAEETYAATLTVLSADGTSPDDGIRNAIQASLDANEANREVPVDAVADWSLARQAVEEVRAGK
jgi:ABC-type nitrate/sulfonate/bicarbonate transport system substrate-binding protein